MSKEKKDRRIDALAWYIFVGVVAICLVVCAAKMIMNIEATASQEESLNEITCFQDFEANDFDGNVVDESIFADYKLTVINCWETTCSPCVGEMPDLYALSEEYEKKDVQIIGLCGDIVDGKGTVDESLYQDAQGIVASTGAAYRHLIPSEGIVKDLLIHIVAFPTTILVDSTGEDIYYVMGAKSADEWRQLIDTKLEEME